MTDGLRMERIRERARIEVARRYPATVGTISADVAFVAGAVWHASMLPTRYQIAEVLWNRANRWEPGMLPFNDICSVEREYWMKDADAVLALWDGAGS